ncbi:signal peptidase I [Desulfatibacillum aliphaticivorans]|uniref:Signal peptidase I n=1 Tax=Desulfatibacillum aliphaticivorans TaxID=218208 RepID=B8F9X3_DESAL|nr:signal peptidase I [Desulfatibacillum aliphaticivorans]ACL03069.1 signal peptidase I [Desulfatibacillum aliphaticivorans]
MKQNTKQKTEKTKAAPEPDEQFEKPRGIIRENLEALLIALLLALFIRAFLVAPFKIPSGSMEDTLLIGDQIFVSKFSYGIRLPFSNKVLIPTGKPDHGDIIVFIFPRDRKLDYVKRVIGLPGDEVQVHQGIVYINKKRYEKQWGILKGSENRGMPQFRDFGPIVVPENSLFAMGDNRDNSSDSRYWGFVPYENLRGRAFMIYFSKDKSIFDVRWNRIAKILH